MGGVHACGLDGAGQAYCWGADEPNTGQLGNGQKEGSAVPVAVVTDVRFADIYSHKGVNFGTHSCALESDGTAWCWGANDEGGLGSQSTDLCVVRTNSHPCTLSPTLVEGGFRFTQLALGQGFTCGLESATKQVHCWGSNYSGQLGDGSGVARPGPQPVSLPTP